MKYTIALNDANITLISFLKKLLSKHTIGFIFKLIRKKKILINDKKCTNHKQILKLNDVVTIQHYKLETQFADQHLIKDIKQQFTMIYQDDNFLVVYKPANLVVHEPGVDSNSLDNQVINYLNQNYPQLFKKETIFKVSHVNRLDKVTQGLVIYPLNKQFLNFFEDIINNKDNISKTYIAKVVGQWNFKNKFKLTGYIYKDEINKRMIFNSKAKSKFAKLSSTEFELLSKNSDYSIIKIKLLTGRKHQIRACLDYLKFPIWNDTKYHAIQKYSTKNKIELYAYQLKFSNCNDQFSYLNDLTITINDELTPEWFKNLKD